MRAEGSEFWVSGFEFRISNLRCRLEGEDLESGMQTKVRDVHLWQRGGRGREGRGREEGEREEGGESFRYCDTRLSCTGTASL